MVTLYPAKLLVRFVLDIEKKKKKELLLPVLCFLTVAFDRALPWSHSVDFYNRPRSAFFLPQILINHSQLSKTKKCLLSPKGSFLLGSLFFCCFS